MAKIKNLFDKSIKPNDLFLRSKSGSYSYGDLHLFSSYFAKSLEEFEISATNPLGLSASSSDLLILMIASCWIQHIPFISFNPNHKNPSANGLKPAVIITDKASVIYNTEKLNIHTFEPPKAEQESTIKNDTILTDSEAFLLGYFFTSGTSSKPKIVPLKRRQMLMAAKASARNIYPLTNKCWLLCMPLNHVGGISVILRSLLYGSAIYRMDTFNTREVIDQLSNNQAIVAASLVPTMLGRLLNDASFTTHAKFKAILLGGGPVSSSLLNKCMNRNIPVITSYGMTETCAQIAANPLFSVSENPALFESAGSIFEPNKIEIRTHKNKVMPAGKSGNIWLKGPQIFDGYYNDPNHVFFDEEGWFNTGDFGRMDKEGRLYIEARRTDLIISGGENISPFEVEDALLQINAIQEAAVFGVPDNEWGQKMVAAVVFYDMQISETSLQTELKKHLETFKVPKKFIFIDALPKTETGKIKRAELADLVK